MDPLECEVEKVQKKNPKRKGKYKTSAQKNQYKTSAQNIKKIFFFQPYYLLQWHGVDSKGHKFRNSWEPIENLNCPDLVSDFESNRIATILGKYNHY